MDSSSRRYTDEEVAQILKRSTAMQRRLGAGPAMNGLSLEAIQEIGQEIGLPAGLISEAAAGLEQPVNSGMALLVGGGLRRHAQDRYPSLLSDEQVSDLLDLTRRTAGTHGAVSSVPGGAEWHGTSGMTNYSVSVTRRGEETVVDVGANAAELATLTWILPPVFSFAAAAVLVDSLQPGLGGMLAFLGVGAGAGLVVARGIWGGVTRHISGRVGRLRQALAAEIGSHRP